MSKKLIEREDYSNYELDIDSCNPAIPMATKILEKHKAKLLNLKNALDNFKKNNPKEWQEISKSPNQKVSIIEVLSKIQNGAGIVYLMEHYRPYDISNAIEKFILYFENVDKNITNIFKQILNSKFTLDLGSLAVKYRYKADTKRYEEQVKRAALRKKKSE